MLPPALRARTAHAHYAVKAHPTPKKTRRAWQACVLKTWARRHAGRQAGRQRRNHAGTQPGRQASSDGRASGMYLMWPRLVCLATAPFVVVRRQAWDTTNRDTALLLLRKRLLC